MITAIFHWCDLNYAVSERISKTIFMAFDTLFLLTKNALKL